MLSQRDQSEPYFGGVPAEEFRQCYAGVPPWDIGRPQAALVQLVEDGRIGRRVLDVGCGTGDNAIYLALRGHDVFGIDLIPVAVETAKARAADRHAVVRFEVHDALNITSLGGTFDTVLDSGVYHVFSDADRETYERGLRSVLQPGGMCYVLCFSEHETRDGGPRRVREQELRNTFAAGWSVESIEPARYEAALFPDGAHAWLASVRRM